MQQNQQNQTIYATDLVPALQGYEGFAVARSGPVTFLIECQEGHSIVSMTKIGTTLPGYVPVPNAVEQWEIVTINVQQGQAQRNRAQQQGSQFRQQGNT
jgi:hypothetical protein